MRSLLVEFHRFNDLDTGIWRKGDQYLVAAASQPVREHEMPLDHEEFLDLMLDLRYQEGAEARIAALEQVGKTANAFLGVSNLEDLKSGNFPLQLDLVVNPAELAALPFEAATDQTGEPLFVRRDRPIELTRRVRHGFAEISVRWPARPKVLYAWACPAGAGVDVPVQEHGDALRTALRPWIGIEGDAAAESGVLTTLAEASLESLGQICRESADGKEPFTHIHLLAHGYPVGRAHRQRFGMALHDHSTGELQAVMPEALAEAIAPLGAKPVVLSLATCDAGNLTNTLTSKRSIAHALHMAGFPVVIASQLPFTVAGSNVMVRHFYESALTGKDVRAALHECRVALYESRESTGHDWASLIGYVQLPEGYAEHLLAVRLESVLAALGTAQAASDKLVARGETHPALFDRVMAMLRERIDQLQAFLKDAESQGRSGVLEENLGLLGSAEKRLAELCFIRRTLGDEMQWQTEMREALERSHEWYRQACDHNLSHHWTGVQYLSLNAVLHGTISEPSRWYAAALAAEIDRRKPKEFWAHGSLAELYLLAPLAGEASRLEEAGIVLREMKERVKQHSPGDTFPLESTERQLRRYAQWWTVQNGFFTEGSGLAAEASRLLKVLHT